MTTPVAGPAYQAARNGMPGDLTAVNHAAQADQFLATHGIIPVYAGNRVLAAATPSSAVGGFTWLTPATVTAGWLSGYDADQSFTLTGTTTGRVQVPVTPVGNGADLQVSLYPDNGSGSPLLTSQLATTIVPAAHITTLAAAGSLASAGPLVTSRYNTTYPGSPATFPWTQPAVSINGSGNYAACVTSGNWTLFIGGFDSTATAAVGTVAAVRYLGGGAVSGAVPQPALPQPSWYLSACATTDALIAGAGTNGTTHYANVWSASWDDTTGTLGAWSAQQALPQASQAAAMAAWGTTVYVIGGSTAGSNATAVASVWVGQEQNGQITAWTAGPVLPQQINSPYAAVIGDWLIVCGGISTAGTTLSATWYSAINPDGSLAGWTSGPVLPEPVYAYSPGWNLVVTDSAMIIVSGSTTGGTSVCTQILAAGPAGIAPEWQLTNWSGSAYSEFQAAAYPSGSPGGWEIFLFHLLTYDSAVLSPVPLIPVPLPATGLTSGHTYHLVFRQLGGDLNNYLTLGQMVSSSQWLYSARYSGGPWTAHTGHEIPVNVYDQTPGGLPLHLYQDSGVSVTTLVQAPATGQLLGTCESAQLPGGPLNANTLTTSSSAGWAGFNGTFTVTSSPPAGATYPYAGKIVNNGTAAGAMEESGGPFPVAPDSPYTVTCRVYSSVTTVQAGCDWFTSTGSYISTGTQTITVTANTWTLITTTVLISASAAAQAYPRVGSPNADGSTIYTQAVSVSPVVPGQVATATQVVYAGSQPSGLVTLA